MSVGSAPRPIAPVGRLPFAFAKRSGVLVRADVDGKDPDLGKGSALRDDGLQAGERSLASELAAEKVRKSAKDVFLNEAIHILSDAVGVLESSPTLATRVKSGSLSMPD